MKSLTCSAILLLLIQSSVGFDSRPSFEDADLIETILLHHDAYAKTMLGQILEPEVKNLIDIIIRSFLEKIRVYLEAQEPFVLDELPVKSIKDENVKVDLSVKKLEMYKGSKFVINNLQNHLFSLIQEFNLTFPELDYNGDYETKGKVLGHTVNGNGRINVWMKDLTTWGKAYAQLVNKKVQIKRLDIEYKLKGITAKATGLKVEGKTDEEVESMLNKQLLNYFTKNEKIVCKTISKAVIEYMNGILKNLTIKKILEWLQHFKP